jgi:hypothetical protein
MVPGIDWTDPDLASEEQRAEISQAAARKTSETMVKPEEVLDEE